MHVVWIIEDELGAGRRPYVNNGPQKKFQNQVAKTSHYGDLATDLPCYGWVRIMVS